MIAAAALVGIAALDLTLTRDQAVFALFAAVPTLSLAAPRAGTRTATWIGAMTLVVAVLTGVARWREQSTAAVVTLIAVVVVSALCWASAAAFERQRHDLSHARAVTDTVVRALWPAIPACVGPLRAEARYLSAATDARLGGDLYHVVSTPYGVRLLIADVMGHGLGAVETATSLLTAFRDLAGHEQKMTGIALRLDAALAHDEANQKFATAVLAGFAEDGSVELLCCGHPPPLLLRACAVMECDSLVQSLPLGLMHLGDTAPLSTSISLADGDRMLFYTDGVGDTRDAGGRFYPLIQQLTVLADGDSAALLDQLVAGLLRHAGGRLRDDAALLLIERPPEHATKSAPDGGHACGSPLPSPTRSTGI